MTSREEIARSIAPIPIEELEADLAARREGKLMTIQELAQKILDIAQKALEDELKVAIYISDDPGKCDARTGLEAIIALCQEATTSQDGFRQYEKKKKVSHETG